MINQKTVSLPTDNLRVGVHTTDHLFNHDLRLHSTILNWSRVLTMSVVMINFVALTLPLLVALRLHGLATHDSVLRVEEIFELSLAGKDIIATVIYILISVALKVIYMICMAVN